jgi:heat shock protein HslJ
LSAAIYAILALAIIGLVAPGGAAERGFPFDKELMLDARPMKGSKRVPMLEVEPSGKATIDLWCNSLTGQVVIADNTMTVITGAMTTARQCDADRLRGDEDLLAALQQVTGWARDGTAIVLHGPTRLRFYPLTN